VIVARQGWLDVGLAEINCRLGFHHLEEAALSAREGTFGACILFQRLAGDPLQGWIEKRHQSKCIPFSLGLGFISRHVFDGFRDAFFHERSTVSEVSADSKPSVNELASSCPVISLRFMLGRARFFRESSQMLNQVPNPVIQLRHSKALLLLKGKHQWLQLEQDHQQRIRRIPPHHARGWDNGCPGVVPNEICLERSGFPESVFNPKDRCQEFTY
jgi:hypothetical protein